MQVERSPDFLDVSDSALIPIFVSLFWRINLPHLRLNSLVDDELFLRLSIIEN